jgi:uncharacterized protein YcbX
MSAEVVGTVSELWRYPVKSMGGERLGSSTVTDAGLAGDRSFGVVDVETGHIASAKHPRRWGRLLDLSACLAGNELRVTFPDGATHEPGPELDAALSAFFDREVVLATAPPEGAIFEEVWDEGKDDSPRYGQPLRQEEGRDVVGLPPSPVAPKGTFFDFSAIHLVTSASLAALDHPDVRRFRPNLLIEVTGDDGGFVENDWARAQLQVGEGEGGVALDGVMPTMRCIMTTLPQPGLAKEAAVLRAINAANRITVGGMGEYACLGLFCRVRGEGMVRVGDEVRLAR